ncbi:MAG: hypothetical protein U5P41_14875 [Gammaproteobacteria bacterium]|nr:hypothetical protein [Gammaproteobacteria bacterium]
MQDSHPLYQPLNRRRLKIFGIVLALLTLAAEPFVHRHAYFGFADVFGFNAAGGLVATITLIVLVLLLAAVLRRPENYYDTD